MAYQSGRNAAHCGAESEGARRRDRKSNAGHDAHIVRTSTLSIPPPWRSFPAICNDALSSLSRAAPPPRPIAYRICRPPLPARAARACAVVPPSLLAPCALTFADRTHMHRIRPSTHTHTHTRSYCRIQAMQHALTGFARSIAPVPVVTVEALDDSKLAPFADELGLPSVGHLRDMIAGAHLQTDARRAFVVAHYTPLACSKARPSFV